MQQLRNRLKTASKSVPIGATYMHYKGGNYRVTDLVINEATQKVMVVYVPTKSDRSDPSDPGNCQASRWIKFARPVEEWDEPCNSSMGKTVPRFERQLYTKTASRKKDTKDNLGLDTAMDVAFELGSAVVNKIV